MARGRVGRVVLWLKKAWNRKFWRNPKALEAMAKIQSHGMSAGERRAMLKKMSKSDMARLLVLSELYATWTVARYGVDYEAVIAEIIAKTRGQW